MLHLQNRLQNKAVNQFLNLMNIIFSLLTFTLNTLHAFCRLQLTLLYWVLEFHCLDIYGGAGGGGITAPFVALSFPQCLPMLGNCMFCRMLVFVPRKSGIPSECQSRGWSGPHHQTILGTPGVTHYITLPVADPERVQEVRLNPPPRPTFLNIL